MGRALSTAAALFAVLAAPGAGALAAASYTVRLKVPRYVNDGQTVHLKASGTAGTVSHLTVFIAGKRCASNLATEAKRSSDVIISRRVAHAYSRSVSVRAKEGTHNVCAYLTSAGHGAITRARRSATYYVLAGGY